MILEKLLESIVAMTAAVNKNTEALAALNSGAPAKTEAAATTKVEKVKVEKKAEKVVEPVKPAFPTEEEIVEACQPILQANKGPKLKDIAAKYGFAKCREAAGTEKAVALLADLKKLATESDDSAV